MSSLDVKFSNIRKIGGPYFRIVKDQRGQLDLLDIITEFHFKDYYCFCDTTREIIEWDIFIILFSDSYSFYCKKRFSREFIESWCFHFDIFF